MGAFPLRAQFVLAEDSSRIRVRHGGSSDWTVGTLVRSDDDSLYIATTQGARSVARSGITRLDISRDRKPNTLGGLKNGAIVGGAIGTVLGVLVLAYEDDFWLDYGAEVIPISMAGGSLLGGILGAGFGTLQRIDRWERVEARRPGVTVIVGPGPDGARLGLAARF
jgi:hypothetical protein